MTLSEKLQTLRRAAGLSQEALAEQLGVTRQAVSKWETGEGKPDIDYLLPLAKLLHTTVDYLLDDTADTPRAEEPQTPPQTESVGRELWEQLKTFGRRWGWLGGYAIAVIGAVRLVTTLIVLLAGGSMLGGMMLDVGFSGALTGFGLAYYAIVGLQVILDLAMIVGGIALARWLKKKYNS